MIYFMRSANSRNVKIGHTDRDPRIRIKEFGLPRPKLLAVCPGGRAKEQQFFRRFSQWRISSDSEWFKPAPELLQFISKLDWDAEDWDLRDLGEVQELFDTLTSFIEERYDELEKFRLRLPGLT